MAKVGWIGLGIMGEPMCRNVLAAGHDITKGTLLCVLAEAHQLFSIARERGFGEHDISAVLRALTDK